MGEHVHPRMKELPPVCMTTLTSSPVGFREIDRDKDGQINLREFMAWIQGSCKSGFNDELLRKSWWPWARRSADSAATQVSARLDAKAGFWVGQQAFGLEQFATS